jgi:hypothetical protein
MGSMDQASTHVQGNRIPRKLQHRGAEGYEILAVEASARTSLPRGELHAKGTMDSE